MKLEVEIPKEFKKELSERFNERNARDCQINVYCPLCRKYKGKCKECPFGKFEKEERIGGCEEWIEAILGEKPIFCLSYDKIFWNTITAKRAKEQLRQLREKAEQLIKWT